MIIGTCGFCSTGSSAINDYLMEFDEVQSLDSLEFTVTYLTDGLEDLEFHLMKQYSRDDSSNSAILRFRKYMLEKYANGEMAKITPLSKKRIMEYTDDFLDKITQITWRSASRSDVVLHNSLFYRYFGISLMQQRVIPYLGKRLGHTVDIFPIHDMKISVMPENFYEESRRFIKNILIGMGADFTKKVVLDQPFSGNDPGKSMIFFEDAKAIIVDRDPRDIYLFNKYVLSKKGFYMPSKSVEEFATYFKLMRKSLKDKYDDINIMKMNFEDLVYDYENTTQRLRIFCDLKENKRPKSIFVPEMSMANTQLFKRFSGHEKEIEYIEKELEEYLFDFSKYPAPSNSGEMFMGKSPLNR